MEVFGADLIAVDQAVDRRLRQSYAPGELRLREAVSDQELFDTGADNHAYSVIGLPIARDPGFP